MIKKTISRLCLGLGLAHMYFQPSSIIADESDYGAPCCEAAIIPGEPLDPCLINAGYPYPATIKPNCGWNLYAKGDFLYWSANIGVAVFDPKANTADRRNTRVLFQQRSWSPGFRVSLGADLCSVVLDAQYMRMHNTNTTRFSARANETLNLFPLIIGPTFGTVKSRQEIFEDYVILSVQKPVYIGKKLILNAFYGIIGGWHEQNYKMEIGQSNAPPTVFVTSKQKYWNVGPDWGLISKLILPWGFRGLGNINLSMTYAQQSHGRTSFLFPNTPTSNLVQELKNFATFFNYYFLGEIGLGWESYFCCESYHAELAVTYNFVGGGVPPLRSLQLLAPNIPVMNGIAISCRIDF